METEKQSFLKTLRERLEADTPPFFKKLRLVGLILVAAGGTIVASPITLPAGIVAAAGYLIVAGSVASAVSQAAVEGEECKNKIWFNAKGACPLSFELKKDDRK